MLIKIKRSWELPERIATPEALVFNRRGLLKGAGALALSGALANCGPASDTETVSTSGEPAAETADPTASLYPGHAQSAPTRWTAR